MNVTINGFPENIPEHATITQLIALFRENDPSLIVEWNGQFVHPREYDSRRIGEGDRLEFIKANIGG